ncbi:hypothetical protein [Pseudomonas sp. MIACH]|uniref:hypothetical protein n=1 Tax=Pseudomonas sp. MIACH TaxID=1078355 RepID=UPI00069E4F90|nr:hypothetical protein [Pseudomonas sp. MIACH]
MSSLHALNRSNATQTANDLSAYIGRMITTLKQKITESEQEIKDIDSLTPLLAATERSKTLRPTQERLQAYQLDVDELAEEYYGFGWLFNRKNTKAAQALRDAAKEHHNQVIADWDATDAQAQLTKRITQHNQNVSAQKNKKPEIERTLAGSKQLLKAFEVFERASAEGLAAASGKAWLAGTFTATLLQINAFVRQDQLSEATALLGTLVYQKRPTDTDYATLQSEAERIRDEAYRDHYGVPVTGGFGEIVGASAKLAAANMEPSWGQRLLDCTEPANQWQLLTQILTSPLTFSVDVLWSIYWAMLQCEDQMAKFLSSAVVKEDPLNGRFSAYVDSWLSQWAGKQIPKFGYPTSQSYLGTFHLAGTPEESRVAADIGLIISLNVGGLVCRKVALLQAKRAKDWVADVGSKKGQLTTLSSQELTGYYLFYHESPGFKLAPPVPTVSSALALQSLLVAANRGTLGEKILLDVSKSGWDWASFITFGLCDPVSAVGQSFDTIDHAFQILGNDETGELPQHLFLLAIEDEGYVRDLQLQVRTRYPSVDKPKVKRRKKIDKDDLENGYTL